MKDFNTIYETYKNNIYHLALSYTKNRSDAEDIVVNTFIKLYKNMSKIQDDTHLRYWLYKVAINECKTLSISFWKKNVLFFKENEEGNIKAEVSEDGLLEELEKLPKLDRIVIHLFYYENYKIEEIATILRKSPASIKTRLHRARITLKTIIKEKL